MGILKMELQPICKSVNKNLRPNKNDIHQQWMMKRELSRDVNEKCVVR